MATITLEYDARSSTIQKALDLLISLGAKVTSASRVEEACTEVEQSMQEAREGKVNCYETVDDMFRKLGI